MSYKTGQPGSFANELKNPGVSNWKPGRAVLNFICPPNRPRGFFCVSAHEFGHVAQGMAKEAADNVVGA